MSISQLPAANSAQSAGSVLVTVPMVAGEAVRVQPAQWCGVSVRYSSVTPWVRHHSDS